MIFPPILANEICSELRHPTLADLHNLPLALKHFANALKYLVSSFEPSAVSIVESYLAEWKAVEKIRNGLEHEEEYLAGDGTFSDMPDANWEPPAVGSSRWSQSDSEGLVSMHVLGREYFLKKCIVSAFSLRDVISSESERVAIRS